MSTTRSVTRAKSTQATGVTAKKASTGSSATTGLSDVTNHVSTASSAKKSSSTASSGSSRSSLLPITATGPVTPRSQTHTATARVPASAKTAETVSKPQPQVPKAVENWLPLPTPVPISSSRSFSELMKSEEQLSAKLAQLQALCEKQQRSLAEKDAEIKILKSEVVVGQEQVAKVHRSWEAKTEAVLSQQQEKYQDLNERYLTVLTRARACETKLEELLVDPLTLKPFDRSDQTRESSVQQQRTLMALIEEHQQKESVAQLEYQKATERMLRQAAEELCDNDPTTDDLLSLAREGLSSHSLSAELRQIELSIPNLIESTSSVSDLTYEEADSDLDWSVMTSDEDSVVSPQLPISNRSSRLSITPSSFGASEGDFEDAQGADDSFFNDSYVEEESEPLTQEGIADL